MTLMNIYDIVVLFLELGIHPYSTIKASVKLEEVPLDSAYAMVKGAVYNFSFHTLRYSQNPLVIQVLREICWLHVLDIGDE